MFNTKNIIKITTNDYIGTLNLASSFAKILVGGDIVSIDGDLGAGKTAFTKGVAKGLGIETLVSSPTFTILHEYVRKGKNEAGIKNLYHFDVYRLINEEDFFSLGFDEYLGKEDSICIIEWGEKIKECLPESTINIYIHKINNYDDLLVCETGEKRIISIFYSSLNQEFSLFIDILKKLKYDYKILRSLHD